MTDAPVSEKARAYVPCPLCKQYSHSIRDDQFADAFMHFQSMIAHPVRGHPMGNAFDDRTRDAAQVLMAHADKVRREVVEQVLKIASAAVEERQQYRDRLVIADCNSAIGTAQVRYRDAIELRDGIRAILDGEAG